MEPDVIRMYSSSPPPMEDGAEEEDDEFGDFGTFSGLPGSISFSESDTPTAFDQSQASAATSPPDIHHGRGGGGFGHAPCNGSESSNGHSDGRTEARKTVSSSSDFSAGCNGREVSTNGFVTFDLQGSPSPQNSVPSPIRGPPTDDEFADFASFPNCEGTSSQREDGETSSQHEDGETSSHGEDREMSSQHKDGETSSHGEDREMSSQREDGETSSQDRGTSSQDGGSSSQLEDTGTSSHDRETSSHGEDVRTSSQHEDGETSSHGEDREMSSQDGGMSSQREDCPSETSVPSSDMDDVRDTDRANTDCPPGGATDRPSPSGTEDEDESREAAGTSTDERSSETSSGRPSSADASDEFGDASTTCSAPSPPFQGDEATPTPAEDEEDFGDFGDAQDFADFERSEVQTDQNPEPEPPRTERDDNDYGDFNCPAAPPVGGEEDEEGGKFADFPSSESFGNFSSAKAGEDDSGWSAFGDDQNQNRVQDDDDGSWAAFSAVPSVAPPTDGREEEWEEGPTPAVSEEAGRTEPQPVASSGRSEKSFLSSFPNSSTQRQQVEQQVETSEVSSQPGGEEEEEGSSGSRSARSGGVWMQLQDVQEAWGSRYQWGGSHCNKVSLCCLGIDTRNISFTGQKKQPVIVPMYAAGSGMSEPTKEPMKPVSAAEMIASIAQTPPAASENSSRRSDPVQEALPPVQFDWSSSGLTNPSDGVDPELFELTTTKSDPSGAGSRVADAFARLMSTMEKTSTSTRKPRKDENSSEEASKVIAASPDSSFMQAKVSMFPATSTPLCSQGTPD